MLLHELNLCKDSVYNTTPPSQTASRVNPQTFQRILPFTGTIQNQL